MIVTNHCSLARSAACLGLALLATFCMVGRSRGEILPFSVEAEEYVDSFNKIGFPIETVTCTSASNGLIVQGLDGVGEWIELNVDFPASGFYMIQVGIQGYIDRSYELRTTLRGAGILGEDLSAEFHYVGQGVG